MMLLVEPMFLHSQSYTFLSHCVVTSSFLKKAFAIFGKYKARHWGHLSLESRKSDYCWYSLWTPDSLWKGIWIQVTTQPSRAMCYFLLDVLCEIHGIYSKIPLHLCMCASGQSLKGMNNSHNAYHLQRMTVSLGPGHTVPLDSVGPGWKCFMCVQSFNPSNNTVC